MRLKFTLLWIACYVISYCQEQPEKILKHIAILYDDTNAPREKGPIDYFSETGPWDYHNNVRMGFVLPQLSDGIYHVYEDSTHDYLIATGAVVNHRKTGKWHYYYPNDTICQIADYVNGQMNGSSKQYNHLGELYADLNYKYGMLYGKQTYYGKYLYACMQSSADDNFYSQGKKSGYEVYNESRQLIEAKLTEQIDTYYYFGERKLVKTNDSLIYRNSLGMSISRGFRGQRITSGYGNLKNTNQIWKIDVSSENGHEIRVEYYDGDHGRSYHIFPIKEYMAKMGNLSDYKNLLEFRISLYSGDSVSNDRILQHIKGTKALKHLQKIEINQPGISKIPSFVYQCKNLKALDVYGVRSKWSNEKVNMLLSLERFSTACNPTNADELIARLSLLPKLKILDLWGVKEWHQLKNLPLLQNITQLALHPDLPDTAIFTTDIKIPEGIFKLKNLTYFTNSFCGEYYYKSYKTMLEKLPNCFYSALGTGCLQAGTKILLANHTTVNIENVKAGDVVLSYDTRTNTVDTTLVTKTFVHKETDFDCMELFVQVKDSLVRIGTTSNHPFFKQYAEIINAGGIRVNDKLMYIDGSNRISDAVVQKTERLKEKFRVVYNIETTKHTYFANGILVHNK